MTERIGILGGTFNPVHVGHLLLAQDALEQLELDQVLFLPCALPPHKDTADLAPARDRQAMLEASIENDLRFSVDTRELDRGGVSWTVDTLDRLRRAHPSDDLVFVIGTDTLRELHTWRRIEDIIGLCRFAVVGRPGFDAGLSGGAPGLTGAQAKRFRCTEIRGHAVDVSSREIRMRIAEGLSVRYLVPDAVAMYIAEHRLYVE